MALDKNDPNRMPLMSFDRRITMGNLITIVVLVGGLAIGWGQLDSGVKASADLRPSVEDLKTRVTVLENYKGARDRQIADIQSRVDDNQSTVETKLDKLVDEVGALSNAVAALTATIKATSGERQ